MTFIVAQGVSLDVVEDDGLIPHRKVVIDDIQWGVEESGSSHFLTWVAGAHVGVGKTWVQDSDLVRVMNKYKEFREWLKCCVCGIAIQPSMKFSPSLLDGGQSLVCSDECRHYDDKPVELNSKDPYILKVKEVRSSEFMDMLEKAVDMSAELSNNIRGADVLREVIMMAHARVRSIAESQQHNNEDGFSTLYTEGFFLGMMFGKLIAEKE